MNELLNLNWQVFESINQPASSQSLLGRLMIFGANDIIFLAPLLLLVLWLSLAPWASGARASATPGGSSFAQLRAQGQRFAILGCLAVILAVIFNLIVSHLVFEPRPFVAHPSLVHQLVPHAAGASFPSDHEAVISAVATILVLYLLAVALPLRRFANANSAGGSVVLGRAVAVAAFLAVLSLLAVAYIGVSRVYVGVHYPGDILGGAATGAIAGGIAVAVRPVAEPALGPLVRLAQRFRLA